MAIRIEMPKFGLSMEEGTIADWLVQEGDEVKKGDLLADINSEKLTNTVEAPADGFICKLLLDVDETALCGDLICIMGDHPDEDISALLDGDASASEPAVPAAVEPSAPPVLVAAVESLHSTATTINTNITPRAKKRAEELNLEYTHITGTGIGGAITISDLKQYGRVKQPEAVPVELAPSVVPQVPEKVCPTVNSTAQPSYASAGAEDEVIKMTPIQSTICTAMFSSLSASAQSTLATEANVQNLVKTYQSIKGKYTTAGVKLSYTAMIIKAVAMALEHHPMMRAQLVDDKHYKISRSIDIGVAVDIPDGLIVPVIHQANLKDLRTICIELSSLTGKAKTGTLTAGDLGGAVTTVTNLGMFGVTYFTPILNVPESTILGIGTILKKPVERDSGIFMESTMNLSLTHDHRVSNGAACARYLQDVVAGLQDFRWC